MNWSEQEQIAAFSALAERVLPVFYVGLQKGSIYMKISRKSNKHILNIKATLFIEALSKLDSIEQKISLW